MASTKKTPSPRAPRFTKAKQDEFVEQIRQGMRRGAAAEHLGFKRAVVDGLIAEGGEFAARVSDAEKDANEHVEEALYQAAINGNVPAAKVWLERTERQARRAAGSAPLPGSEDTGLSDEEFAEEVRKLTAGT